MCSSTIKRCSILVRSSWGLRPVNGQMVFSKVRKSSMRYILLDVINTAPQQKSNSSSTNSTSNINPFTTSPNSDFVSKTVHSIMISSCHIVITLSFSKDKRVVSSFVNSLWQSLSTCQDQPSSRRTKFIVAFIQSMDFSLILKILRNTKSAFSSPLPVSNHSRKISEWRSCNFFKNSSCSSRRRDIWRSRTI